MVEVWTCDYTHRFVQRTTNPNDKAITFYMWGALCLARLKFMLFPMAKDSMYAEALSKVCYD